ncbi:polysaccharide lyase [Aurantiacibacter marinus]|nr:hypothetical protein [Aurantiacibacter marinus]
MLMPAALMACSGIAPAQMVQAVQDDLQPVWSADFDTDRTDRLAAIMATIEDLPEHRARQTVSLDSDCGRNGAVNSCALVTLRPPEYDESGELQIKYNVNGEIDLDGYRGTEATLTYRFHMEDGADLRIQGKLPGLSSLRGAFGGDAQREAVPDSWSTRLMWLGHGQNAGHPRPSLYIYDQFRARTRTGEHNLGPEEILSGRWHEVAMYVRLNDPGLANGRTELWMNGELAACRTGLTFRNTASEAALIQRLAFHNYYGGSPRNAFEWPEEDVEMRFDDFAVYDGRATPAGVSAADCDGEYSPGYLVPKSD